MTPVSGTYHPGEIEVQRRAGVRREADEVGAIIGAHIPPIFVPIVATFRIAVAASIDSRGRVWASLLTGPAGFLHVLGEERLRIDARPRRGDPLEANLTVRPDLGLLLFDPATRRRMRFNGQVTPDGTGGMTIAVEQAYGNCRKYIQRRQLDATGRDGGATPVRSDALTPAQQAHIAAADTFFIASAHPAAGADASHRGGSPGFVRVADGNRLSFPDYPGNNMFNTLGNLVANPRAGLLFVDFERGDLLQITGRAALDRNPEVIARHHGTEHLVVDFEVDEVIESAGASSLRGALVEPSPFNP